MAGGGGGGVYTRGCLVLYSVFCDKFLFYHNLQVKTNRMRYRLLNLNVVKGGFGTLEKISG